MAIGDVLLLPFFRLPYLNSRLFMYWKQQQPDETTTQEKWEIVVVLFFFSGGFFKQLTFTQKLHANNDDE